MVKFSEGIKMLITCPGRLPLCLKCNSIGHNNPESQPLNVTVTTAEENTVQNKTPIATETTVEPEIIPEVQDLTKTADTVDTNANNDIVIETEPTDNPDIVSVEMDSEMSDESDSANFELVGGKKET